MDVSRPASWAKLASASRLSRAILERSDSPTGGLCALRAPRTPRSATGFGEFAAGRSLSARLLDAPSSRMRILARHRQRAYPFSRRRSTYWFTWSRTRAGCTRSRHCSMRCRGAASSSRRTRSRAAFISCARPSMTRRMSRASVETVPRVGYRSSPRLHKLETSPPAGLLPAPDERPCRPEKTTRSSAYRACRRTAGDLWSSHRFERTSACGSRKIATRY